MKAENKRVISSPVDLLPKEDVHWLQRTHLLQSLLHFEWNVVLGQFVQHVVSQSVHDRFTRFSGSARTVFWLNAQDAVQDGSRCLSLVTVRETHENMKYNVEHDY